MSRLVGSKIKFELHKDKILEGYVVDKYRGLTAKTHEGPWSSGGRGEYDTYFSEDYMIVEVKYTTGEQYHHVPYSSFRSWAAPKEVQVNS
jgi:hypothetical protein